MVSRPTWVGGLGFGLKWDMGWMHDTLRYLSYDPIFRKFHHNEITFRMLYAFTENFVLPLSHDEVVHGKGSLIGRMPGDYKQKMANLRLLFGYMFAQPGKKLIFMGGEFGQWNEWYHEASLDWHLLNYPGHSGIRKWIEDLNRAYRNETALHELDSDPSGFTWIDGTDVENTTLSFLRRARTREQVVLCVFNFTPLIRSNYRVGVPYSGIWFEILNSDASDYSGSGAGNQGQVTAAAVPFHGQPFSVNLTLPPLGALFFKHR
jgi:1,4-alpha-glucan branching enzyme